MNIDDFKEELFRIQGKTVAIVYIFENETAEGYNHYDIWKSDVISEWLLAIQENNCRPLILDARTFMEKIINKSLPHVDAVINLNNGNSELSTLALIPSVCSFANIPCIPCNTVSIIAGENKLFSNLIAKSLGLNVPRDFNNNDDGIFRTINYGSSRGTYKTNKLQIEEHGFQQEFIKGYDITTPLLYNPIINDLEVLPTVMYYPEDKDVNWFFNEIVKEARTGYKKKILHVDETTKNYYIKLAKTLEIDTFCRIDARISCDDYNEWENFFEGPVNFSKIKFIEINPMPTLKQNINFHNSIDALSPDSKMYSLFELYKKYRKDEYSKTGFVLFCSLLSIL